MKKVNLFALLFLCLFSFTMVSCDKDKDDEIDPSITNMLTDGEWVGAAMRFNNVLLTRDQLYVLTEGMYDISTWTLEFNKNGTGTTSLMGETGSGKWELADKGKTIIFSKGTEEESRAKILKLTASELHLEFQDKELEEEMDGKAEIHFVH
ncbi:hypothetical protein [Pontibacter harenae]|uniref:hypothetical protein n=1 Tax=Pontibacter harenae TaxID=2894083 RepID=UPI001E4CDB1B|nr:hypothetical protein [Pontibacter harenae]MCC9168387.1 hypothetical protein [Pontibacter harenae]